MGFDAFGLPAENYAIKTGIHPHDSTMNNIDAMRRQLKEMGGMFNWDYEVVTCDPKYYKWTQWVFLKLYERGLAYKKEAPVNWCPSCQTVLANEQVIGGKCERCETRVYLKNMSQWFLKITDYAEELLQKLDELDWPEKAKAAQRNWIGKSTGAQIKFKVDGSEYEFEVFTTRPDTIFGVSYVVLAPEHELVDKITADEYRDAVEQYKEQTKYMTEIDRQSTDKEKTGVFTGAYALHPITNKKLPIWIADYVLVTYGTGSVMAVPAHDSRDYAFAKKYNLPIIEVVSGGNIEEAAWEGDGSLINSEFLNGLNVENAKAKIIEYLEEKQIGKKKVTYRLRDWLISRQRYWGAPIPIIYCEDCGTVPVPEKDLPVKLPYNVSFMPNGQSPLATCDEFKNTTCPRYGKKAVQEVDTMDTFMCSSWYFLRYPDANNDKEAFNTETVNKMLPVDKYVGGAEHSCMHLIYARFVTKALRDAGYLNFDEPFISLLHQGTILGPDGQKMSKSRGNTVSPDDYIKKYGSDIFRTYLMFGFNFFDGGPWNENGIIAISKYFERFERNINQYLSIDTFTDLYGDEEIALEKILHSIIKAVTNDINAFQFNMAVARMMELTRALKRYLDTNRNTKILKEVVKTTVKLFAPGAPHTAEEYWEMLGEKGSIFNSQWPEYDESKLETATMEIAVQFNGRFKTVITVPKEGFP